MIFSGFSGIGTRNCWLHRGTPGSRSEKYPIAHNLQRLFRNRYAQLPASSRNSRLDCEKYPIAHDFQRLFRNRYAQLPVSSRNSRLDCEKYPITTDFQRFCRDCYAQLPASSRNSGLEECKKPDRPGFSAVLPRSLRAIAGFIAELQA